MTLYFIYFYLSVLQFVANFHQVERKTDTFLVLSTRYNKLIKKVTTETDEAAVLFLSF